MNWKYLWSKKDVLTPGELANKRRAYIFLLCFLCSALFWLVTKLSRENQSAFQTEIVFEAFPEGLLPAYQSDSVLRYTIRSTGIRLVQLNFMSGRERLTLDAAMLPLIERPSGVFRYMTARQILAELQNLHAPWGEVTEVWPDTVFLQLVASGEKKLPVKLEADISFHQGFNLYGDIRLNPDSVVVSGPVSVLDTIDFIETQYWDATRLRQTVNQTLKLELPRHIPFMKAIPHEIEARIPVEEYTESSVEISLNVICPEGYPQPDVRLFPGRVNVTFLVALRDYSMVTAELFSAAVECPSLTTTSDGRLAVSLTSYPSFVDILSVKPEAVEYIVLE